MLVEVDVVIHILPAQEGTSISRHAHTPHQRRWIRAELFVVEPAPIVATVERLGRKGGRDVVARCPSRADADVAAVWLVDRLSRFAPELPVTTRVESGGGQFLLVLRTA